MPSSEYSTTGGGLKLKGAKDAGVDKKKRKKKPKPESDSTAIAALSKPTDGSEDAQTKEVADEAELHQKIKASMSGKTESERRHEEIRRKRLEEKLKKEGVKTHKERVEELNKYLSGLSEHHDMPRIGPG